MSMSMSSDATDGGGHRFLIGQTDGLMNHGSSVALPCSVICRHPHRSPHLEATHTLGTYRHATRIPMIAPATIAGPGRDGTHPTHQGTVSEHTEQQHDLRCNESDKQMLQR